METANVLRMPVFLFFISLLLAQPVFLLNGCHRSTPKLLAPRPREEHPLPQSAAERVTWRKVESENVYDAVLGRGLELYGPHMLGGEWKGKLPECTFFLSIDRKDPSEVFLKRFAGKKPTLMKGSARESYVASALKDHWQFFAQVASLYLGNIVWQNDTHVTVDFIASVSNRAAASWRCQAEWQGNRWVVTQTQMTAVA